MFVEITRRLLQERRVSGFFAQGLPEYPKPEMDAAFHKAFGGKTEVKGGGRRMHWGDWLIESMFPTLLYEGHKESLWSLAGDRRLHDVPSGFSGDNSWTCAFGQIARPRPGVPEGFVRFMLERVNGKYRGMPHYYFDTEDPAWVTEPLSGRPDIPKTWRTSVSCVMNLGFHWLDNRVSMSIILRHTNWSHEWGDVYGANLFLRALAKETKSELGHITIFANSASMDEPKIAKQFLKEIGNGIS